MTANTNPVYSLVPNVNAATPSAGNTKSDGSGTIGTDIFKALTAGTNGSWLSKIRLNPIATVAGTATTATVGRVFISSQASGATTSANTYLVAEVTLSSQTADSSSAATYYSEIPLNVAIPAGWTVLVTNHVAPAANTGWQSTVYGGDY